MKYQIYLLVGAILLLTSSQFLTAQSCSCTEYVYLNETTNGGSVHKYTVAPDGTLTEIGNPWYDSSDWSAADQMASPHGLGTDLNGFLYIGESFNGDIRKLDCDGNIFSESAFVINDGGFNIKSVGNTLYVNPFDSATKPGIFAYDLCTGQLKGYLCVPWHFADWGFHIDDNGTFYVTNGYSVSVNEINHLYVFTPTEQDFIDNTCMTEVMVSNGTSADGIDATIGSVGVAPIGDVVGVTTDPDGNIYIVQQRGNATNDCSRIFKYSPTYELLAISTPDCSEDGSGYFLAIGIVYSETCNCLYVSTESPIDDCAVQFNLDLTQSSTAVPPTGTGEDGAKGIAINKECCPTPLTQTINQVYCKTGSNEQLFLNELFPCEGIICGASWAPADAASTAIYSDCDQSIASDITPGCYSFTKVGSNNDCGSFDLTFNLEILQAPEASLSADQTVCSGSVPAALSVTTTASNIQWQMSTTSCTDGFADIAGATTATYTPNAVTTTTYYRAVVTEVAGCSDGNCAFESDCITIMTSPSPTLTAEAPVCATDGSGTYSVAFTSDATVTASTGTVSGSSVTGVGEGTDVTLTSTSNGCTTEVMVVSPTCITYEPRLGKTVDVATASLGQTVTFTLTVYNDGTGELTGVEVTDVLPAGLTYTGDDSGGSYDSGTGLWAIPTIAIGDSAVIEIMATMDVEGVVVNSAEITAADQLGDDPDLIDNQDAACVSVPVEVCDNEAINVNIEAPTGYTNYQWYKDGVLISGATSELYNATEVGSYTYTVDGVGPGDCMGELCCPVVIEQVSCCPPLQCIPITVTKLED